MAASGSGAGDVFDVRKVRRLVELMNEHDLGEIDLRQADQRIRLRKRVERPIVTAAPSEAAPAASPAAAGAAPAAPAATPADDANIALVKSPMVGTFYTAASPDVPAFVKVGDHIGPESTVCVIEAMKVFNEIPAEVAGLVLAVLVENGDPVEYGQPLFKIDTSK